MPQTTHYLWGGVKPLESAQYLWGPAQYVVLRDYQKAENLQSSANVFARRPDGELKLFFRERVYKSG